ncbi:MAG: DUF3122 domain-containing protein [Leptolyngbya sp. SIO1E4]|nr:DUF3122 domain-containing protein [Leptolyngbya sp. SIO1E4]
MPCFRLGRRYQTLLVGLLATVMLWATLPQVAQASLHTYRERPGQVTYRSRQSLRDYADRAWQAIAFKRLQGEVLQGIYLRLVGFPGAVRVDRQQPIVLLAPTGQQWQLAWEVDPQTQALPDSVGQYDLQPFLANLSHALPLEMQIPLDGMPVADVRIAPFIVAEWLQVKTANDSPSPVVPTLGK